MFNSKDPDPGGQLIIDPPDLDPVHFCRLGVSFSRIRRVPGNVEFRTRPKSYSRDPNSGMIFILENTFNKGFIVPFTHFGLGMCVF